MQTRMVWKACELFTHVAIKIKALMKYSPPKTTYLIFNEFTNQIKLEKIDQIPSSSSLYFIIRNAYLHSFVFSIFSHLVHLPSNLSWIELSETVFE